MVLARKGQLVLVGMMIAFLIFLFVVVLIEPTKEGIDIARDADHLDCGNASIGTGNSMACIVVDAYLPAWVGFGLAVAIGYIGIRKLKPEEQV